jgi:hypothetical protein
MHPFDIHSMLKIRGLRLDMVPLALYWNIYRNATHSMLTTFTMARFNTDLTPHIGLDPSRQHITSFHASSHSYELAS